MAQATPTELNNLNNLNNGNNVNNMNNINNINNNNMNNNGNNDANNINYNNNTINNNDMNMDNNDMDMNNINDNNDGNNMNNQNNTLNNSKNKIGANILITGTPGVGKTTLVEALCEETGFKHIDINSIIKIQKFHDGFDKDRNCLIVDEDKLIDHLETIINGSGGNIFDTHLCGCFPSNWFDLIIVLRCNNTVLFDRLKERGYKQKKIKENIEAEIMQVIYDEAIEYFDKKIVIQLNNDNIDQQDDNIDKIKQWIAQYTKNNN